MADEFLATLEEAQPFNVTITGVGFSTSTTLSGLFDVDDTDKADLRILQWNSVTNKHEYVLNSASVLTLDAVGDVDYVNALAEAQFLRYNAVTSMWENELLVASDISDYDSAWDARLALKDTDDLTEGTNLYYTEARVSANTDVAANTAKVGVTTEISNVVEDTTPELGGTLDAQSNDINNVGTLDVDTLIKSKQIAAISVPSPVGGTSIPLGPWKDVAATISKIRYFALPSGTTVDFNIEERASTTPGTTGTDVLTSDVTASETPAETTSFANATIGADANLHLTCSAITGTPTDLVVVVYGKED